jgi:NADH:ubiquinone oxidoreductase subunit 5 (subunit L)/multisubunit Na+/H+ antiporter MnhA subunit
VGRWLGCAKDDIKKALAGSTMSQIGYMMLGRRAWGSRATRSRSSTC